jgi:DNA-binding NarL/FixJ family response regulator
MNPLAPRLRLAEAAGVLSLATDVAMGQPLEHGLRTAMLALRTAAGQPRRPVPLPRPAGLSERECEVLGLIARGMATKQVARQLGISPKTCDHHIQRLYRKTGLSTRAGATLFALEHGLIDPGSWS